MESYERDIADAQHVLERRDRARDELEDVLSDRSDAPEDEAGPGDAAMQPPPQTWPRLPI